MLFAAAEEYGAYTWCRKAEGKGREGEGAGGTGPPFANSWIRPCLAGPCKELFCL